MKHDPFQLHDEVEIISTDVETMAASWVDAVVMGRTLEAEPRYTLKMEDGRYIIDAPCDSVRKKPRGCGIGSCLRDRDLKTQSPISLRKKMTTKIAIAQSGTILIQIKMSQTLVLQNHKNHMTCRVQMVILRKIRVTFLSIQKARTSFMLQKK